MRLRMLALGAALLAALPAHAQPNPELIRVAISREDPKVTLQIYGRFRMFALHTQDFLQEGRRLDEVDVRAVPQGLKFGEQMMPLMGVRIEPESRAAISLNGKRLRGTLEIVRQQNLTLLVINHISVEEYLRGVLSKEAPDYWPPEALKAIAIAARTYAVYQRFTKETGDYDVTGDVMSQDYGGKSSEKAATTRAVKATAGVLLLYDGKLFPPFYHSTCGGRTENGRVMGSFDIPPLAGGVECRFCAASPFYAWTRRLTREDVNWALVKSPYGSIGRIVDVRVSKRTMSGRAEEIMLKGALRAIRLSGYDFRALFGFERIRGLLMTIIPQPDAFLVEGRGWGHGVGLCQFGAAELARRGLSAAEILAYYYPGAALVSAQDLVRQPVEMLGGPTHA